MTSRKSNNPPIDEQTLRYITSESNPTGSVLDYIEQKELLTGAVPEVVGEKARRKKSTLDYEKTFLCPKTFRHRANIYISEDTRDLIQQIVQSVKNERLTIGGYIEVVLRHHLETYREPINERLKNAMEKHMQ